MAEDKHAAFVRLADKRLESVEDAIRIFSNLSGPSYEWSVAEVQAYLYRITTGVEVCLQRFTETRQWRDQVGVVAEAGPIDEIVEQPEAPASVEPVATASLPARDVEMLRIWREADHEQGALIEMLAMQREVIRGLQAALDEVRRIKNS